MKRALFFMTLATLGCATNYRVDPEGYRCDVGDTCPLGYSCLQGVCTKAVATCDVTQCGPRAPECTGASARRYLARCANAACVYDAVDTACTTGCMNGACTDACAGVTCSTPPVTSCLDANTLHTFAATGTCVSASGLCQYTPADVNCPNGCEAGHCRATTLCMGVTCTTPPAPLCVGQAARTFSATGTCDPGTGQCGYTPTDTPCPAGCQAGQCAAPLSFTQVGPRVRFAINSIDIAPGGGSALAVGNGGRVARWNGADWLEVTTPANNDLNRVHFVAPQVAYVAGAGRTLWQWRNQQLTTVSLSGNGNGNLVALYGRSENNVLVADSAGAWWKFSGGATWATGNLPSSSGPFTIRGAYIDETNRERLVGLCGNLGSTRSSCVATRNGGSWSVSNDTGTLGFDAVGGSFSPATTASPEVLLGEADRSLTTHVPGNYSGVSPSPALTGGSIVGIAADSLGASTQRSVYVQTSSANTGVGQLYQLDKTGTFVGATPLLETFFGAEALSVNVAAGPTGGVLLAEVNRVAGANNVFRHQGLVDEALDLGEDFVGASVDAANGLVVATIFGDLGVRRLASPTWDFMRSPPVSLRALEARNGASVWLAGKDYTTTDGVLMRWQSGPGFARVVTRPNTTFNALCRVSDTEGWAVGTGGVIYSVTAMGATSVTSGTTRDLLSVDCVAGAAVACGDGVVLRATNGAWAPVTPAFPVANKLLTHCRLAGGAVWALGDNAFQKLEGGAWSTLPAKSGVSGLVVRSATEVYAAVVTSPATSTNPGQSVVTRFDGSQWKDQLTVTGVLGAGVQVGPRVLFAGTGGLLVEGR